MADNPHRIRLPDSLPHTATSVEVMPDGGLVVEFYDFSPQAHEAMGRDVAYQLRIDSGGKELLLASLIDEAASTAGDRDQLLLDTIRDRFQSYFQVKDWLEKNAIPFRQVFDDWA
jgi:hypothetical protein